MARRPLPPPAPEPEPALPPIAIRRDESPSLQEWFDRQVRRTPWWCISLAAHLLLLAVAAAWVIGGEALAKDEAFVIRVLPRPKVVELDPKRPVLVDSRDTLVREKTVSDEPVVDEKRDPENQTPDSEEFESAKGDPLMCSTRDQNEREIYDRIGVGGAPGGVFGRDRGGRARRAKQGGGGTGSEAAVMAGLQWLARHQNVDGSWNADTFHANCRKTICEGNGKAEHDPGLTGLALLAFLGAGYTHVESGVTYDDPVTGQHMNIGNTIRNGVRWLVRSQDADGCLGRRSAEKMMYSHAIATLALAEAYGLTTSPLIKEPAQKAVNFLIAAKNPYLAWRYSPRCGDNDTSVVGWAVMALKSAKISGLDISESAMEETLAWVEGMTDPNTGRVGYLRVEDAGIQVKDATNGEYANHQAMTAVGMTVRMFLAHDPDDPMLAQGAKVLVNDRPVWDPASLGKDYYYWYYATLALFQFDGPGSGNDGRLWKAWNTAILGALLDHQGTKSQGCAHGSWPADDRWGRHGGRVYATAINTLSLEVYYRYEHAFGIGGRK